MFQAQKDSMDCWWKVGLLSLPSSRTRVVRGHSLIDLGFNLKQKDARIIAIIQYWIRKLQSLNIRFIKNRKYIAITRYLDSNSPKAQEQLSCFQDTLNKIIIVFTLIQWTIKTNFVTKMTGSPGQTRPLMWINKSSSWEKFCKLIFFQIPVGIWWHWVSRGHYLLVFGGTGSVLGGTD